MNSPFAVSKLEILLITFVFLFSFAFFYKDTFQFGKCLFAALLTTGLFSASYMILRWFYLSITEKN